ncbi:MAG: hypothetical protein JKY17_06530 [Magnetovibrio sp.]|nr:hypothetical protein [Magnetovibrio sp.]
MFEHLSEAEIRDLIERPHTKDFLEAAQIEAAHQTARWGEDHDANKSPEEWLWVVAYLTTKAIQAARYNDREQYLHHIITAAAAMANWHRIETGRNQTSDSEGGQNG